MGKAYKFSLICTSCNGVPGKESGGCSDRDVIYIKSAYTLPEIRYVDSIKEYSLLISHIRLDFIEMNRATAKIREI